MKILITIIFCLIIPILFLTKTIIEGKKQNKNIIKDCKWEIILTIVLIIGSLVRIVAIDRFPNALNVDEASSGYDAFSLFRYGKDRGGNSYPVYLYAWGSGQSVLYSYIMIPFIMLGGLSVYTMRLPMALIGIAALYIFYYLLKNIFDNKKLATIGTIFLAICPWHIMKSRWGMECNIFPEIVMLAVLLLVLGLKNKKTWLQILSFVILGLSSYSYGTSYLFLPVFVLILLAYLIKKKEFSIKKSALMLAIIFVVCIPMILYVIINTFNLNPISIGKISIPRLLVNRYDSVSSVFSGNILGSCAKNIVTLAKILLLQSDGLEWNAIPQFGAFYLISNVFFIIGLFTCLDKCKSNKYNQIINIWALASVILAVFCDGNINRLNIIMLPIAYYISVGIYEVITRFPKIAVYIGIMYIVLFGAFMNSYLNKDYNKYFTFTSGMEEVVDYCNNLNAETIYCEYSFKEPFIYFLFYGQEDVNTYLQTVEYYRPNGTFENIKAFGKYRFYLPENIEENTVIIVKKDTSINKQYKNKVSINQFDVYQF